MATSKRQKLAREDYVLSLGAVALPLHIWAIINILKVFPAWLLRSTLWDLVGAISYPLVGALLESTILWGIFLFLGYILPENWLAGKFVALSAALGWLLAGWAVLIQYNFQHFFRWDQIWIYAGLFFIALSLAILSWLIHRFQRLAEGIKKIAQGIEILAYFYLAIDLFGLVIIIIRNLT